MKKGGSKLHHIQFDELHLYLILYHLDLSTIFLGPMLVHSRLAGALIMLEGGHYLDIAKPWCGFIHNLR